MKIAANIRSHILLSGVALLTGCSGTQSALNPMSDQANRISGLWWLFFSVLSVIYILVLLLLLAITFRKTAENPEPILIPDSKRERRMTVVISGALGVTVIILFIF